MNGSVQMMEQINQELKVYIETNILPLYQGFDAAHGPAHVRQVLENSLSLIPAARELFGEVDAGMAGKTTRKPPGLTCWQTRTFPSGFLPGR